MWYIVEETKGKDGRTVKNPKTNTGWPKREGDGVDGSGDSSLVGTGFVEEISVQGPYHSSFGNCGKCSVGHKLGGWYDPYTSSKLMLMSGASGGRSPALVTHRVTPAGGHPPPVTWARAPWGLLVPMVRNSSVPQGSKFWERIIKNNY
jgi:hypothetical protein